MKLPSQLSFLSSVSFWCGLIIAVANYMCAVKIIPQDIVTLIETILGSVIYVRVKNQVTGMYNIPPTSQNG